MSCGRLGETAGDCIDCYQCVAVCPTGIDIRNGSQLDCIQCGLCIDACDTVMKKIGREARLIGYDNDINIQRRQAGKPPIYRIVQAAHHRLRPHDRIGRCHHAVRDADALAARRQRIARPQSGRGAPERRLDAQRLYRFGF